MGETRRDLPIFVPPTCAAGLISGTSKGRSTNLLGGGNALRNGSMRHRGMGDSDLEPCDDASESRPAALIRLCSYLNLQQLSWHPSHPRAMRRNRCLCPSCPVMGDNFS